MFIQLYCGIAPAASFLMLRMDDVRMALAYTVHAKSRRMFKRRGEPMVTDKKIPRRRGVMHQRLVVKQLAHVTRCAGRTV